MKRTTWRSKLTKAELKHLKEDANVTTIDSLRRNLEGHKKMRLEFPDGSEPCWTCRGIAQKLGMEI